MQFGESERPPYENWLAQHETLVVYSGPAGEWLVTPDLVWQVHDLHRSAEAADAIAWFAVENRYPGECEGYIPCYATVMDRLYGEYLRRHPRGQHLAEAVEQVHESLAETVKGLSGPFAKDFSNDCGELKRNLEPLRQAVVNTSAARRQDAIAAIDQLLATCR